MATRKKKPSRKKKPAKKAPKRSRKIPKRKKKAKAKRKPKRRTAAERLEIKRLKALELLMSGMPVSKVAQKLKVDRRTLYTWRQDDTFQEAQGELQAEAVSQAKLRIANLTDEALDAVRKRLKGLDPQASLRAADMVLNRMPGLEASQKQDVLIRGPAGAVMDLFAGRSADDLEYYAREGYFPEEAPRAARRQERQTGGKPESAE